MRELTPQQLLHWVDDRAGIMRLATDRDALPGGYMAAMAPALVSWPAIEITPDGANVVLRNVNYGGNPFERITVLQSLRLSIQAVEAAELILVPPRQLRGRGPIYHVQVRYIFEQGAEPVLLSLADAQTGTNPHVPDLVLSWEAWRPPGTRLGLRTALGIEECGLSLRAYAGAQRYLEDTVRGGRWQAYRLRLPGGRRGLQELLAVSLTLGDGLARHTLAELLDAGEADWLAHAPRTVGEPAAERWQQLKARLRRETDIEDRLAEVPEGAKTYHALLRSCVTLTRYLILLAARRAVEHDDSGDRDSESFPEVEFADPQPWMTDIAGGDLLSIFVCAPTAARFLLGHPESRPGSLPDALDAAGLLERRDGKRVEVVYGRRHVRPYGPDGIVRSP